MFTEIHSALVKSFTYERFREMLKIELNTEIEDITLRRDSMRQVVLDVLIWAEEKDMTLALVQAAYKFNPIDTLANLVLRYKDSPLSEVVGESEMSDRSSVLDKLNDKITALTIAVNQLSSTLSFEVQSIREAHAQDRIRLDKMEEALSIQLRSTSSESSRYRENISQLNRLVVGLIVLVIVFGIAMIVFR